MCVLRWIWAGLICLSLTACSGLPQGGVSRSEFAGLAGGWSAVEVLPQSAKTRHHVILARGYVVRQNDVPVFTIRLGKHWDGVHSRLRVSEVSANGRSLPFKPARRYQPFTHDMTSHHTLIGTLVLDPRTLRSGLDADLIVEATGQDGTFTLTIPRRLFVETIRAAHVTPEAATPRLH